MCRVYPNLVVVIDACVELGKTACFLVVNYHKTEQTGQKWENIIEKEKLDGGSLTTMRRTFTYLTLVLSATQLFPGDYYHAHAQTISQ